MNELITINKIDLAIKNFKGQRVVTFKDIDLVHERVEGTAKRNFNENRTHFIENEDYFIVNGVELKQLKQGTNFVLSNAKEIILITESGYLMLAKSLQDDLAWKVQRELVKNYFKINSNMAKMSKELQAIFVLDERTVKIESKVNDMENNMPLFNVECKELQGLVRKIGIKVLGGYKSPAYNNKSLRTKIYKDIQGQLKREFGVDKYEAIKRIQLDKAREIVSNYTAPIVLEEQIILLNDQIKLSEVIYK